MYDTPKVQRDILRAAPDESAPFVKILMPMGWGAGPVKVEILSRQGAWEEVRLYYRFKYNGSTKPGFAPCRCTRELLAVFARLKMRPGNKMPTDF